jgi:hypothetical protein
MKFSYEVGIHDKHRIDFACNHFWGTLSIRIDGQKVAGELLRLSSPTNAIVELDPEAKSFQFQGLEIQLTRVWTFGVGTSERHFVRIEKERPKWFAGCRPHSYRLFVDGQLEFERKGF